MMHLLYVMVMLKSEYRKLLFIFHKEELKCLIKTKQYTPTTAAAATAMTTIMKGQNIFMKMIRAVRKRKIIIIIIMIMITATSMNIATTSITTMHITIMTMATTMITTTTMRKRKCPLPMTIPMIRSL